MFFQQREKDVLPTSDPSITQNSEPSNSNWQKWAKWGLTSAGGAVLTTAVFYYGGPVLWAGLSSLIAGASRFSKDSQSTALSQMGQQTTSIMNSPNDVPSAEIEYPPHINKYLNTERDQQAILEEIEAYSQTEEAQAFFKELKENNQPLVEANKDDEDDKYDSILSLFPNIDEGGDNKNSKATLEKFLPPAIERKQKVKGLKESEEELPLISYHIKSSRKLMGIDSSSISNEPPILVNNTFSIEKGGIRILTTENLAATDPDGDDALLVFEVSEVQHGQFELASNQGVAITRFTQQQIINGEIQFVHDNSNIAPMYRLSINDGILVTDPKLATVTFEGYSQLGDEFQVNSYIQNNQQDPSVSGIFDDDFVVVWASYNQDKSDSDIYAQVFYNNTTIKVNEFRVNTNIIGLQGEPRVAMLNNGKFVIVWDGGDGDSLGIYGQLYHANNGTRYGTEFRANTYIISAQWQPCVSGLDDGKFIITWYGIGAQESDAGIYGQLYNSNGSRYGPEFHINSYIINEQGHPSVAGLSNEKFVVTWNSIGQDGSEHGIYGQLYNTNGTKYGSEFQINTYISNKQIYPSVSQLRNGRFVVIWESYGQDGSGSGIYGQMYNADGTKHDGEFRVNTYTQNDQGRDFDGNYGSFYGSEELSITNLNDGKFVAVWGSEGQDNSAYGVYGQIFNDDGTKYASEFQVNTYTLGNQGYYFGPSVAKLGERKFIVAWDSQGQDGSGYGIFAKIFSFNNAPQLQQNTFTIHKYQSIPVTPELLSATDIDTDNSTLIFMPGDLIHGEFELTDAPGIAITEFIQTQIANGEIQFVHDGSEYAPSYRMAVSDGIFSTSPISSDITLTAVPTTTMPMTTPSTTTVPTPDSLRETDGGVILGITFGIIGGILVCGVISGCAGYLLYRRNRLQELQKRDLELDEQVDTRDKKKLPRKVVSMRLGEGEESQLQEIEKQELKTIKKLGQGAFGTVFLGEWEGVNVAIKKLHNQMMTLESVVESFEKEAAILSHLRHPNIIQIYGICRTQYEFRIVMEYASEGSLDNFLGDDVRPFPWNPTRLQIAADVANGLGYIHRQNIWHRDLKSGNVLIHNDDTGLRAKLTDFGEAKVIRETTQKATKGIGTLSWMAPEIMKGEEYTEKADVYSYGLILWQLATKESVPYKEASNQFQLATKVQAGERPKIPDNCPQSYAALIKGCWHSDPDVRPNMKQVKQEVKELEAYQEEFTALGTTGLKMG